MEPTALVVASIVVCPAVAGPGQNLLSRRIETRATCTR